MSGLEDIAEAIAGASEPLDETETASNKPRILVDDNNPDRTVAALRDVLAASGQVYDRGVPVRVAFDQTRRGVVAHRMTAKGIVLLGHGISRPYRLRNTGGTSAEIDARLPIPLVEMYLDWKGEWNLPLLNGIAAAPLLHDDGSIVGAEGFDPASGMWCDDRSNVTVLVPVCPSREDAAIALRTLRDAFKTFPFADAEMIPDDGIEVVDINRPPGHDESAFLAALLTAVCRASLDLAPGLLIRAASLSGSGTGKGLLARCISAIAFGREPHAVTSGGGIIELEKRISAELIDGSPMLLLDNLNGQCLRSDLLASAITERKARVRVLGRSEMAEINPSCFFVLTGNGLTVSEDLVRRFLVCELDPKIEDPEARLFPSDILHEVTCRRRDLLAACITIWRWGRQYGDLRVGLPLGSFNRWGAWVRDPLLSLGNRDPADRIRDAKRRDVHRETVSDVFRTWNECHGDRPVPVRELHERVRDLVDPHHRGRQFLARAVQALTGTRLAGYVLTCHDPASKHGVATYRLESAGTAEARRNHMPDEGAHGSSSDPMTPMTPMPSDLNDEMFDDEWYWPGDGASVSEVDPRDDGSEHRDHQRHRNDQSSEHADKAATDPMTPMPTANLRRAVGGDDADIDLDEPWSTEL